MKAQIVNSQAAWQKLQATFSPQLFLQSWEYQAFFKNNGDHAFMLGIYQNNQLVGGSLVGIVHAKRGNFYYLPYGPLLKPEHRQEGLVAIRQFLSKKSKQDRTNFVRISPYWEDTTTNYQAFKRANYRPAPIHVLAETSWILELNKKPEQLLKAMRQNHRNLIRRAEREGVTIKRSQKIDSLKTLHELLSITAKRHHFIPFSLKYMEAEFQALGADNLCIYEAHYNNTVLGSAIIYFTGNTAVYRHSGSTSDTQYRKIPANYAIQWAAIQDAQDRGLKYYNFWGIAPENASNNHPFKGITRFKKGFGGQQIDLIHCHDYPFNYKYWFNFGIEKIRSWRRGFSR